MDKNTKAKKAYAIGDEFFITGKALYCFTTKPNNKGTMPSNKYEVCVTDFKSDYNTEAFVTDTVITDKDGNEKQIERIKIANSKYPFPVFDVNNKRYDEAPFIPNGTPIELYVQVKHTDKFDKDYLICKAIKTLEVIEEFNPFKNR